MILSPCQEKASAAIEKLILSKSQELIVSGAAGVGKSELLKRLPLIIESAAAKAATLGIKFVKPTIYKSAPTNAAANLIGGKTINVLLGLSVIDNKPVRVRATSIRSTPCIVVIDECSYIDGLLMGFLEELLRNPSIKILYMGDKAQLKPVKEDPRTIFDIDINIVDMITPVRQDNKSELYALCTELRNNVLSGEGFVDIRDWYNDEDIMHVSYDVFDSMYINASINGERIKFVSFSNPDVLDFNAYAYSEIKKEITSKPASSPINVGDTLVCNRYHKFPRCIVNNGEILTVKEIHVSAFRIDNIPVMDVTVEKASTRENFRVTVATGNNHLIECPRDVTGNSLEMDRILDARHQYGSTIHKAQGQTYDTVFIDLAGIRTTDDDMFRRLLYVAVSRAKYKVVLAGELE